MNSDTHDRFNEKSIRNAEDFQAEFCEECIICESHKCYPSFCYEAGYKEDPDSFRHITWPRLLNMKEWLLDDEDCVVEFKHVFCDPDVCPHCDMMYPNGPVQDDCALLQDCCMAFEAQIDDNSFVQGGDDDDEDDEDYWDRGPSAEDNITGVDLDLEGLGAENPGQFQDSCANDMDAGEADYLAMQYGPNTAEAIRHRRYIQARKAAEERAKSKGPTVTVFRNRSAEWTKTLKKIFGK